MNAPDGEEASLLTLSPADRNARLAIELRNAAKELEPLVVRSHGAQHEIHRFLGHYDSRRRKGPLPPTSLHRIRKGSRDYLRLQEHLGEVAVRYEPLATADASRIRELEIDPVLLYAGVSMSTAAAVTLYDNYLSLLQILKDKHLRRLLNDADVGYGIEEDELWEVVEGLNAKKNRDRLRHLVDRWSELEDSMGEVDRSSEALLRLRKTIESSVSFRYARDASLDEALPTRTRVRREKLLDRLSRLGDEAVGAISEVFGNGIGMVETRKGKLWSRKDVLAHLKSVLQPLDLLLEKTPFRLTDFFIPGHFGHVAIWMGTAAELEALGVWDQPAMHDERLAAYREDIEAGAGVLEALRPGVELNTLEAFANVDDLAVLRPKNLDRAEVVASLVRGFEQVGKEYDFNFDVETTGTIVCSELPYHVYPGVTWATEEQLGRFTINPDHVAREALGADAAFDLILFCRDGTLLDDAVAKTTFSELVS